MGVNNRERRRAKKHKRQRDEAARGVGRSGGRRSGSGDGFHWGRFDERQVRDAVVATAEAFRSESEEAFARGLEALVVAEAFLGRPAVDGAVQWWMALALDRAWSSGWQPADVDRILRRKLGAPHAGAAVAAVAASAARRPEAAADERWAAQSAAIAADAASGAPGRPWPEHLALAVQALSLLLHLPPLPRLAPPPATGRGGGGRSGAVLERVRALLAKAESTTFAEEAEALTAKAQELMARHAIDEAMLDAGGGGASSAVTGRRIGVEDPYAAAKSLLLDRIATANRCRAVWSKDMGFSTVFGTPGDLDMVEVLFTSLLVQGTDAMVGAGRSVDRTGRSRTRSFRQSFLVAYAVRIGERLAATTEEAVAEAVGRHGGALLPVLAGRAEAVDDAVAEAFPGLMEHGLAIGNRAGWMAGRTAAELATLAVGEELATG